MAIINEYFGGDGKVKHCDDGTFEAYDARDRKAEPVLIAAELPSLAGALRAIRIHFGHAVPTIEAEQAAEAAKVTEPATDAIEVDDPAEPDDSTDLEIKPSDEPDEPII